jgi:hypothetical protein
MDEPRMERRAGTRVTNMIKHAEMMFKGNVLDCVQLDISSGGTRIYLDGSVEIPDVVTLQMYDGTSRRARRLWQRGSQIGFGFLTEHETDAQDLALGPEGK